ncbi:MAG: metallophosphoesterase [Christensenellaceae bacterium]|nr:metallophosphoesterase [Christensenellaceae bacterium]
MPRYQDDYQGRHVRYEPPRKRRFGCLSRLITLALLLFIIAYPFLEPRMLDTEVKSLASSDLPSDIKQLRIAYLSDIHAGFYFPQARVDSLIQRVNALNADLVLLGGDYAVDSDTAIEFFRNLPRISARYGVFAVMGNHDRTVPESNLTHLRSAMYNAGITPLVNDVASVRIGTSDIYIAGIDDVNNGWPDLKSVAAQVRQEDFVIFLCHSPEIISSALTTTDMNGRRGWFDLGLFGHTHGGQIALLGQFLGISKVEGRYEQGWLRENRADILISRGVGTSVLPIRFLRRPQLHQITVISGQ